MKVQVDDDAVPENSAILAKGQWSSGRQKLANNAANPADKGAPKPIKPKAEGTRSRTPPRTPSANAKGKGRGKGGK